MSTNNPSPDNTLSACDAAAGMNEEQLAEAQRYGRLELACTLADKALDLVFLSVMALAAWPLDRWLQTFDLLQSTWTLRLVVLSLIVTGLHVLVSLPLSFYAGYLLEHQFGLSTLTVGRWAKRYLGRLGLSVALGLVMIVGLYWLIWTTGPWWWLLAAAGVLLVTLVLGRILPIVILPLFYKIEPLEAPELTERIRRLAEGTGLSVEGVYRMALSTETLKANAMLAGLGRSRRVLLGDTLIEGFSNDEIEVVLAHEIGHHVFRHVRKMIVLGIIYTLAGFWIIDRLLALGAAGGQPDYWNLSVATLPLLSLVLLVFGMVLEPLQNLISRHHERQSDRYALDKTGLRGAFVSAFQKLARMNKDDPCPPRLEVILFHSHPPIGERLAMAQG